MINISLSKALLVATAVIFLLTLQLLSSGCSQSETERTDANYYYKGINLLAAGKYEDAIHEFEVVIENYPNSPLVSSAQRRMKEAKRRLEAKQRVAEKLQVEEERYGAKNTGDANNEWLEFRNSESNFSGKVTTWKCLFKWSSEYTNWATRAIGTPPFEMSLCYLEGNLSRPVRIDGGPGPFDNGYFGDTTNTAWKHAGPISKDDLILVTGEFKYVNQEGELVVKPIRIIRMGYGGK